MKRPFRGLRDRPPENRYDAVIIGAGIGGLVCANLLVRSGLRVLLVEQHYMVGGYCSAFRRRNFTFDAATHFYPLLGNPQTLTGKLLQELGVTTRWVKMDPVDTFHFPDGSKFQVPADLESYRARLDAAFPHQRQALNRFFQAVRKTYLLGVLCYFRGHDSARLGPWKGWTLKQALEHFIDDPKLRLLLTADCPHWGSPPSRTSFVFDSMLRLSYFLGNYYPEGGSQSWVDELAQRFEEQGGHILMSTMADEILLRDRRASGVRLTTTRGKLRGTRSIEAGVVVSNADLLQTIEDRLPSGVVAEEYRQRLRKLRPSYPCFLVHVGLRGISAEVLEKVQGYYWDSWDPERVGSGALRCKIFAPTLYEPRLAPPGGQIVILQKVQDLDYAAIEDWEAHKTGLQERLVAHLEAVVPGISRHIEVQLAASAETSWKFTLNRHGAMLGWEMSPDQLGNGRPDVEGPVRGLYLVGHWTRPGGGVTPVIMSAVRVAEKIAGREMTAPALQLGIQEPRAATQGE